MNRARSTGWAALLLLLASGVRKAESRDGEQITLIENGVARGSLLVGTAEERDLAELRRVLKRMSGADFKTSAPSRKARGIFVGRADDFPWLGLAGEAAKLGPGGVILRSRDGNLYLIGKDSYGVRNAIFAFLRDLGCRWFFPGRTWEVIPRRKTVAGSWNTVHTPSFHRLRIAVGYGHGAYGKGKEDRARWMGRNLLETPPLRTSHSWHGVWGGRIPRGGDAMRASAYFKENQDLFAFVGREKEGRWGPDKRRVVNKPCYSNPEVNEIGVRYALERIAAGDPVSASAPDGVNYCECDRCFSVFKGGKPFKDKKYVWFGRRPDGELVSATSETLFAHVNRMADAVAKKDPAAVLGVNAYSCYAHPPSFNLRDNIFVQVATRFRRTPLSLDEQLRIWGQRAPGGIGIRGYTGATKYFYDSPEGYAKDKDGTVRRRGHDSINLDLLETSLRTWHGYGVRGLNNEGANSWASRGLGYYVSARLLWSLDENLKDIVRDFYTMAFGPAAAPMERYYVRWYGHKASVSREMPEDLVHSFNEETLKTSIRDLDEAARLVQDLPGPRARVDHLRAYAIFLALRHLGRMDEAYLWAGRLADTHMVHTKGLFKLAAQGKSPGGKVSRRALKLGRPPSHEEIESRMKEARAALRM